MDKFKFIKKGLIGRIPKGAGVYCFQGKSSDTTRGKLLYIGKGVNIRERVKNHFQSLRPGSGQAVFRDSLFMHKVTKIGFIETNSEIEALILEAALIKKRQPRFNVVWRDDKNYFYVATTEEEFPKIFITHQPVAEPRMK